MQSNSNQGIDRYLTTENLFLKTKSVYASQATRTYTGTGGTPTTKKIQSIISKSTKSNHNAAHNKTYQYRLADKDREEKELDQYVKMERQAQKSEVGDGQSRAAGKVGGKFKINDEDMLSRYQRQMNQGKDDGNPNKNNTNKSNNNTAQNLQQKSPQQPNTINKQQNASSSHLQVPSVSPYPVTATRQEQKQLNNSMNKDLQESKINQSLSNSRNTNLAPATRRTKQAYMTPNSRLSTSPRPKPPQMDYSNLQKIADEHDRKLEEEKQSALYWESVVANSSRKYFDTCRNQALTFLEKMLKLVGKELEYVGKAVGVLDGRNKEMEECVVGVLKQYLYRQIDKTLQTFQTQYLPKISNLYLQSNQSQLNELTTQLQQRQKQLTSYKHQIDNDKQWRSRASDLLTSGYEQNIMELTQMLRRSVDGLGARIEEVEKKLVGGADRGFGDRVVCGLVEDRIGLLLLEYVYRDQHDRIIFDGKQQERINKENAQQDLRQQLDEYINKRLQVQQKQQTPPKYRSTLTPLLKSPIQSNPQSPPPTYLHKPVSIPLTSIPRPVRSHSPQPHKYNYTSMISMDHLICQYCSKTLQYMPDRLGSRRYEKLSRNGGYGCDCWEFRQEVGVGGGSGEGVDDEYGKYGRYGNLTSSRLSVSPNTNKPIDRQYELQRIRKMYTVQVEDKPSHNSNPYSHASRSKTTKVIQISLPMRQQRGNV